MATRTRKSGTGSVRQRDKAGKVWQLVFNVRRGTGTKRQQGYETLRGTRQQAEARLRKILGSLDTGSHVKRTKETTAEFLLRWLDTYATPNTSARTRYGYERIILSQLIPSLGATTLADLSSEDVLHMHQDLYDRELSARTVLHAHRLLSQTLVHAVRWKNLSVNPCAGVDAPRARRREMQTLDWQTAKVFFQAIQSSRFRDFYFADFYLGLRRSELLALRWPQCDLERGAISVVAGLHRIKGKGLMLLDTKTDSSRRQVTAPAEVVELLRTIKGQQIEHAELMLGAPWDSGGFVFAGVDGSPLSPEAVTREFRRLLDSVGLDTIRLHDLRHTMASLMLSDGVPMKAVQERLGHSTITTTMDHYAHVLPGEHAEYAERLAKRVREG